MLGSQTAGARFGSVGELDLSLQAERLIKAMMALMQALATVARR
jgi:hypothetical protein